MSDLTFFSFFCSQFSIIFVHLLTLLSLLLYIFTFNRFSLYFSFHFVPFRLSIYFVYFHFTFSSTFSIHGLSAPSHSVFSFSLIFSLFFINFLPLVFCRPFHIQRCLYSSLSTFSFYILIRSSVFIFPVYSFLTFFFLFSHFIFFIYFFSLLSLYFSVSIFFIPCSLLLVCTTFLQKV